jgi:hypothetical protein
MRWNDGNLRRYRLEVVCKEQTGTLINANLRLTPGDIHAVDRVTRSPLATGNSFSSLLEGQ